MSIPVKASEDSIVQRVGDALHGSMADGRSTRLRHLVDLGGAVAERGERKVADLVRDVRSARGKLSGLSKGNLSRAETSFGLLSAGLAAGLFDVDDLLPFSLRSVYYAAVAVADGRLALDAVVEALTDGWTETKATEGRRDTGASSGGSGVPSEDGHSVRVPPGFHAVIIGGEAFDALNALGYDDDTSTGIVERAIAVLRIVAERAQARDIEAIDWALRAAARDTLRG